MKKPAARGDVAVEGGELPHNRKEPVLPHRPKELMPKAASRRRLP